MNTRNKNNSGRRFYVFAAALALSLILHGLALKRVAFPLAVAPETAAKKRIAVSFRQSPIPAPPKKVEKDIVVGKEKPKTAKKKDEPKPIEKKKEQISQAPKPKSDPKEKTNRIPSPVLKKEETKGPPRPAFDENRWEKFAAFTADGPPERPVSESEPQTARPAAPPDLEEPATGPAQAEETGEETGEPASEAGQLNPADAFAKCLDLSRVIDMATGDDWLNQSLQREIESGRLYVEATFRIAETGEIKDWITANDVHKKVVRSLKSEIERKADCLLNEAARSGQKEFVVAEPVAFRFSP